MSSKIENSDVQEYFVKQPERTRKALQELRSCIIRAVPGVTELLNYGIPAYALLEGGKREQQIMIAGYQNHLGFYPHPSTITHFAAELSPYKKGKGSVQFPLDQPLPADLIAKMIRYRLDLLSSGL